MGTTDFIRRCEVCDYENPPDAVRCVCGALLAHIDLVERRPAAPLPTAIQAEAISPPDLAGPICPHADCGMPNPPGNLDCVYCNRSLVVATPAAPAGSPRATPLPMALANDWQVVRPFPASGGEADLYLVSGRRGQAVAKLYRHGLAPATDVLERLKRVVGRPVVTLIDHGVDAGRAWELIEYCPEGNLRSWLAAGPRSREDIIALIRELSGALEALHAVGILHRDLKPENVLLRRKRPLELALADFGAARLQRATQHFTEAARTTLYAAPETLAGVIDAASDWWSVGMIVLEAASGRHPFAGLSDLVIAHHLATRAIHIDGIADDALATLCAGLLLRDPKKRWQAAELRRWLAGDTSLGRPGERAESATLHPYRIGESECRTLSELAAALAAHWPEACRDLKRGTLRQWLDNEWHDQNLLRHLDDLMANRGLSDDRRLLDTLLLLDHRLPPVWKGHSADRVALLAAANSAESDAESRTWLMSLYREEVLQALRPHDPVLADAGIAASAAMNEIQAGWQAVEELTRRRDHQRQVEGDDDATYVDMDSVLYGHSPLLSRLPAERLLPRVIAAVLDPTSLTELRQRDDRVAARLLPDCDWLAGLPPVAENAPGPLLVRHFALPLAEEYAARNRQSRERQQRRRCRELTGLEQAFDDELRALLDAAQQGNARLARMALDALTESHLRMLALTDALPQAEQLRRRAEGSQNPLASTRRALDTLEYRIGLRDIWLQPLRLGIAITIVFCSAPASIWSPESLSGWLPCCGGYC